MTLLVVVTWLDEAVMIKLIPDDFVNSLLISFEILGENRQELHKLDVLYYRVYKELFVVLLAVVVEALELVSFEFVASERLGNQSHGLALHCSSILLLPFIVVDLSILLEI